MELRGKRQISGYVKRSWRTIMALQEKQGFPVVRVGGSWVSDSEEIREWRAKQLRKRG